MAKSNWCRCALGGSALMLGSTGSASAQPANDECTSPLEITGEGQFQFSSIGATTNGDSGQGFERLDTGLGSNQIRKDVWFLWQAPRSAHVDLAIINVIDIFVPKVAVYDGATCPPLEQDLLDAQHDVVDEATVRFNAVEGRSYLIQVGSADAGAGRNGTGRFQLTLRDPTGACCMIEGCAELSELGCAHSGGTYQGDFSVCTEYNIVGAGAKFEDIRAGSKAIQPFIQQVPLGFTFPYYNDEFDSIVISPKGYLTLAGFPDRELTFATIIPDISDPNALIAPAWSNWTTVSGPGTQPGEIHVQTLGEPGVDLRFVAQWTNLSEPVFRADPVGDSTFQAVLFEDGSIEFRWQTIEHGAPGGLGGRVMSGIEDFAGRRWVRVPGDDVHSDNSARIEPRSACSACPADLTGSSNPDDPDYGIPDGDVDADDFFFYLDAFSAGDLDICDIDGDADCDAEDFFGYLDLFVQGCE